MIGIDEIIVNNVLTKDDGDFLIHIDHGHIINSSTNEIQTFYIETTGVTINGIFRSFKDYVFSVQNNLIQFSGSCYSLNNFIINSNRVRLERKKIIYNAIIINNNLIEDFDDEFNPYNNYEYPVLPNTPPSINTHSSLYEISSNRQNVHNSEVMNKFKFLYYKMLEIINNTHIYVFSYEDSRSILLECCKNKDIMFKRNLVKVLDYSKKHNGYVYNIDSSEVQVFRNIIAYLNKMIPDKNITSLYLILFADNLVDCIENDIVVCLTGRVNRMINSIQPLLENNLSKSERYCNILDSKEEMLKIASKLFQSGKDINTIKSTLLQEFNHLNKEELCLEIESWHLEELFD